MYTIIDAANPPAELPPNTAGVMGYIGGHATHVWTLAEWQPFAHVRQYPVWVADLTANPLTQGEAAVKAALSLGWAPWQKGNGERALVFDMETSANKSWWAQLTQAVSIRGFVPVCYGSLSTVTGNDAAAYILADWDGKAVIPAVEGGHGVQYLADAPYGGTEVDYSVFDAWLFARGGVGPRHS